METRAIFSDIFKAFDKGWHKGLIYKLHQYGFTGNLLTLLTDFRSNRKQRVFLNGKYFSLADIKAGFPEGSIQGLLLFPVYVNDLKKNYIPIQNVLGMILLCFRLQVMKLF